MSVLYWWCGFLFSAFCALSFLIFGIYILIISFSLHNPFIFIPLFFSSSLMILVCLSLIAGLTVKIIARLKGKREGVD